jgi:hypothetical protein
MTNLEILRHAEQFAALCARRDAGLEPAEAWHRWSAEHGVSGPGAQYLFEAEYAAAASQQRRGLL